MAKKEQIKPPVVVVLGHVDHGKSSLLEAIRQDFRITAKESGGITQHIGAYEVEKNDKKITFIDTPGHEAFSAMRSRGAKVADIAVLVVDAAEGVKEQTKEAIKFVKEADIPMIVALNKIDKPQLQIEKTKQELSDNDVLVESIGGKIPSVNVSAKTKQGIDDLLETILLVAEIQELKTDTNANPEAIVIESCLDHQKGAVATLIIEKGILKENDIIGTESTFGKVRILCDFQGKRIKQAMPSQPVQVIGFTGVPKVGEKVKVYPDLETAQKQVKPLEKSFLEEQTDTDKKVLNLIIKADVLGSLEAIEHSLKTIPQEEIVLNIVKKEVGNINVSDIQTAESSKAKIFGFRVKIDETTKSYSIHKKIFPKIFEVIYELIEEVRKTMEKRLSPERKRIDLGKIKILAIFKKDKKGQIIGGRIIEGEITKDTMAEVFRKEELIGQGRIKSIEQEKKEISSASKGKEIGMFFQGEPDIQEDDILNVYKEEKEKKTL